MSMHDDEREEQDGLEAQDGEDASASQDEQASLEEADGQNAMDALEGEHAVAETAVHAPDDADGDELPARASAELRPIERPSRRACGRRDGRSCAR